MRLLQVCSLSAAALTLVSRPATAQDPGRPVELRRLATWADRRLRETSGVAVSHGHPGLLWTNNDSGDGPRLYLVDTTGTLRAVFEVRGAGAVDWEALALGPCVPRQWRGRTCVYIADTGDNEERRAYVVAYAVPEPRTLPRAGVVGVTDRAQGLRLRYPDHPHDAEAFALLPDGRLALVTKGRTGPVLRYEIPTDAWDRDEVLLVPRDTLPIAPHMAVGRWVTGAAAAPDGIHVVVRTYTQVYRFVAGEHWVLAGPPCQLGLFEPQGEGVDFLDGDRMILTSERARGMAGGITLLRCAWE
jgi:hypothetical protein